MRNLAILTGIAALCVLVMSVFLVMSMIDYSANKKNFTALPQQPVTTNTKTSHWSLDKSKLLNRVIDQAEDSGLDVVTATLEKMQDETMEVNFLLQGNFMQLLTFIRASAAKQIFLQIDALEITAHDVRDDIKLRLMILNAQPMQPIATLKLDEGAHSWAENHFTNLLMDTHKNLSQFKINAVKYVGYLQIGSNVQGLILLPNGVLQIVALAEQVGSEAAVITQINDAALTFKVQNAIQIKPLL